MKRHLFLTYRTTPLPNWLQAFPDATVLPYTADLSSFQQQPDWIVWLQIGARAQNAVEMVKVLRRILPQAPRVVLANIPADEEGLSVLEAGASGYVGALANPEVLKQIQAVVENGGLWVGPALLQRLLVALDKASVAKPQADGHWHTLSPREREVALAVARGATNKEIARQLDITERTVKAHLSHVFELLHIRDRLQLAIHLNQPPGSGRQA